MGKNRMNPRHTGYLPGTRILWRCIEVWAKTKSDDDEVFTQPDWYGNRTYTVRLRREKQSKEQPEEDIEDPEDR
jgi:hypothetical protein